MKPSERIKFSILCLIFLSQISMGESQMVLINAVDKSFQMGSSNGKNEKPIHTVTFSKSFWMDRTEVTQKDYEKLMGVNPSKYKGDNLPVEMVTWYDAVLYCNARSKQHGYDTIYSYTEVKGTPGDGCHALVNLTINLKQNGYHLPTEAQWEYACRAGTKGNRYGIIDEIAWYRENSGNRTHKVRQKIPNKWGLYDILGNVWEWCNDRYDKDYYRGTPKSDPTGPSNGGNRVLRGGSWLFRAMRVRSAYRSSHWPEDRLDDYGFRVTRTIH